MTAPPPTAERILVVDDEPEIVALVAHHLKKSGYSVAIAASGPDALAIAQRERPALVVLDLMLPGMSGADILRRLRSDARWARLPCIVLTAAGQEAQLRDVEALGASEVMTKPFSPRRLLARVHDHIASAAAATAERADGALPRLT